jgi:hypothetical protein
MNNRFLVSKRKYAQNNKNERKPHSSNKNTRNTLIQTFAATALF